MSPPDVVVPPVPADGEHPANRTGDHTDAAAAASLLATVMDHCPDCREARERGEVPLILAGAALDELMLASRRAPRGRRRGSR